MKHLNKELLKNNIEKIAEYDPMVHKAFGSAYCVIQEDEILYKNCFGYTSFDAERPVTRKNRVRKTDFRRSVSVAHHSLCDKGYNARQRKLGTWAKVDAG